MIDWNQPELTKEAVVREAVPDAEMRSYGHGKVGVFSAALGPIGAICYLGTREKRRLDAWDSAYENCSQVSAYVAAHRTKEATSPFWVVERGGGRASLVYLVKPGKWSLSIHDAVHFPDASSAGKALAEVPTYFTGNPRIAEHTYIGTQEAPAEAQEQCYHTLPIGSKHCSRCTKAPELRKAGGLTFTEGLHENYSSVAEQPTQPTHSAAERERAEQQILETLQARRNAVGEEELESDEFAAIIAVDLQCALNAANERIARLEKMLQLADMLSLGRHKEDEFNAR